MSYRELVFPELCGVGTNMKGEPVEWGLSEYITDVLLQGAYQSVELCDFVVRMVEKLGGKRGGRQVGMSIRITDEDHGTLANLARQAKNPMSTENLVAFARYNKAIFLAPSVKGADGEATKPPSQATAPEGGN